MGMGGFARLYKAFPARYAEWEAQEQSLRHQLGDVSILRDRRDGGSRPYTLAELRARIDADEQIDLFDIGGCGCFLDDPDADAVYVEPDRSAQ